jgi:gamma-glutamylcyclotransferase (GGCT)/AIG2-like uncharacterized protein YtfP
MRLMFLNGTAMTGQPDHATIASATPLGAARTAPRYRFFAVRDAFPGLLPVVDGGGSIEGELYEMTDELLLDGLLPEEPPELELDTIELADGRTVNAMRLRPERLDRADLVVDITDLGGWRAYRAFLAANARIDEVLGR